MPQRFIYLVRHGQTISDDIPLDPLGNGLTALGRQQARLTAQRLAQLAASNWPGTAGFGHSSIHTIYYSTLNRAAETAHFLAQVLPNANLRPARLLWECVPGYPPEWSLFFSPQPSPRLDRDKRQAERAFRKFFISTCPEDRNEVLVCHGNLIRYFLCRVLGAPREHWVYADVYNASISEVLVEENGQLRLVAFNDTGHLPMEMRTLS